MTLPWCRMPSLCRNRCKCTIAYLAFQTIIRFRVIPWCCKGNTKSKKQFNLSSYTFLLNQEIKGFGKKFWRIKKKNIKPQNYAAKITKFNESKSKSLKESVGFFIQKDIVYSSHFSEICTVDLKSRISMNQNNF